MYKRKELISLLDEFLANKDVSKRSMKDYTVDIMCFINWYQTHKHISDKLLYKSFLNALDNSKLSERTKRRRRVIVGEYLVHIGIYSSSHLIVKKGRIIKYYDVIDCEIFMNGVKIYYVIK
ncbi:hypothetical protein [uncultured Clostridium sp.]|uniref:hypothetical protein n=1 Tax=uncultured Clostridium sp. TaxID=59620 RepID=UPI00272D535C|nr:hypothetical protein [uncultured Clostridium sp.]